MGRVSRHALRFEMRIRSFAARRRKASSRCRTRSPELDPSAMRQRGMNTGWSSVVGRPSLALYDQRRTTNLRLKNPSYETAKLWGGPSGPRTSAADCRSLRFAPPNKLLKSSRYFLRFVRPVNTRSRPMANFFVFYFRIRNKPYGNPAGSLRGLGPLRARFFTIPENDFHQRNRANHGHKIDLTSREKESSLLRR
jgi:hypothetical protein